MAIAANAWMAKALAFEPKIGSRCIKGIAATYLLPNDPT